MANIHTPPSTYILRELHDVAVPQSVSWFPQTIGWKALAAVSLIILLYISYRLIHRWWDNRYRTEAIDAISNLDLSDHRMPLVLFSILKIVLVHLDPSNARLFDTQFLNRLNELTPKQVYFDEALSNRWLLSIIDTSVVLDNSERVLLQQQAIFWLKEHHENPDIANKRKLAHKLRLLKGDLHG